VRLSVDRAIFDLYPGLSLVVVGARGVDNRPNAAATAYHRRAWERAHALRDTYQNVGSHPSVREWREAFRSIGVSPRHFPSSIEALLRRAFKSEHPPTINPLVDFYNSVSLNRAVPAGGFDLATIPNEIGLRLTRPGDRFTALGSREAVDVPPGEVAYTAGRTVLTRHFVWRQAQEGLIGERTTEVVLLAEILEGNERADEVEGELVGGLRTLFGVGANTARATRENTAITI